jgi:LuxR family maltose regulon positive regulatory protein
MIVEKHQHKSDAAEAPRWAAIVDAASFDLVLADGTASFDSARAMLRAGMCANGASQ